MFTNKTAYYIVTELVEMIVYDYIHETWMRDFKKFNSTRLITMRKVQAILQKIERYENLHQTG